jgi:hypothetical protein
LGPKISVDDELINKVLEELGAKRDEKASCNEVVDPVCANTVLTRMETIDERERIRRDIAEAFLVSSWTQRLYFDVRSVIMMIFGAIVTLIVFWRVGTVNVVGDFLLGLFTYLAALVLSRLFDSRLVQVSRVFLRYLEGHSGLRSFIVKNF